MAYTVDNYFNDMSENKRKKLSKSNEKMIKDLGDVLSNEELYPDVPDDIMRAIFNAAAFNPGNEDNRVTADQILNFFENNADSTILSQFADINTTSDTLNKNGAYKAIKEFPMEENEESSDTKATDELFVPPEVASEDIPDNSQAEPKPANSDADAPIQQNNAGESAKGIDVIQKQLASILDLGTGSLELEDLKDFDQANVLGQDNAKQAADTPATSQNDEKDEEIPAAGDTPAASQNDEIPAAEIPTIPPSEKKSGEPIIQTTPKALKPIEKPNTKVIKEIAANDDMPDPPEQESNPREQYDGIYSAIDTMAMSAEQADEAKSYADVVLSEPDAHPAEFAALTKGGKAADRIIAGFLGTANRQLGYRSSDSSPDNRIKFGGRTTQSRNTASARTNLVMPEDFGAKKSATLWNQPVIAEFGFPFLNFSSEALINVLKSGDDDDDRNDRLKKMFKDAKNKYGGVWKAIYASPMSIIRQIATDRGEQCTPCYLKADGNELISSESGNGVTVTPIEYYSVDAEFGEPVSVPRDFLTAFYDVIDYTSASKRTYLRYSDGMTASDFVEAVDENGGIPPFYILVPKKALYSRCEVRPGSLFGSLLNLVLGRKPCTMVKTVLDGKKGCLVMDEKTADSLFATV